MPAAPKSHPSKKAASTQAASRAKSGCYTCRIRRKKCDEQRDALDQCQTCVRLRLECLGFGQKRPEWLRESSKLQYLRDKIKRFLAEQGMIKGHSGSTSRSAEDTPILFLREAYADSVSSPASHLSSSPRSDMRSGDHWALATLAGSRQSSPQMRVSRSTGTMDLAADLESLYVKKAFDESSPYEIALAGEHLQPPYNGGVCVASNANPGHWLKIYQTSNNLISNGFFTDYQELHDIGLGDDVYRLHTIFPSSPNGNNRDHTAHYMNHVVHIQYLLGDKENVANMIFQAVHSHDPTREAVSLLASVHMNRFRERHLNAVDDGMDRRLAGLLNKLDKNTVLSADDAMAALHAVSVFLFDGGRGAWEAFLRRAEQYVNQVLRNPLWSPTFALVTCSEKEAFVIKTTLWFDVLASISTMRPPQFYDLTQLLFLPLITNADDIYGLDHPRLSMQNPMGCESIVVWALASISNLAYEKDVSIKKGALSIPGLVDRAKFIDRYMQPPTLSPAVDADETTLSRYYASEIFRTSARLYLQSVVSGDLPLVPEIIAAVEETIACIRTALDHSNASISRAVIRSTVFAFYICGALSIKRQHRDIILMALGQGSSFDGVGNCTPVRHILGRIWDEQTRYDTPVRWREHLTDANGNKILLV